MLPEIEGHEHKKEDIYFDNINRQHLYNRVPTWSDDVFRIF